ncbi:MAG TPA: tetratricopeptide repeat protein [Candidatus Rifleibacterium sp.]|nr:tetratricopeptide repeat protein [Candidatus Rifleibacterium sp.]HPT44338.1 tetratricopeptide repeat protein [Candidatus Rifleibacterium sp.]
MKFTKMIVTLLMLTTGFTCTLTQLAGAAGGNPYLQAVEAFARKDYPSGVKKYYRFVTFSQIVLSKEIRENDLDEAQAYFDDLARQAENPEKPLLFLALIDRITDNLDRAHARLDSLRQKHPRSLLLAYLKGELLLAQNRSKEGRQYLDWVLKTAANSPFAEVTRAILNFYTKSGNADAEKRKKFLLAAAYRNWDLLEIAQAIRLFEIVAGDYPSDPEAFKSLVGIYLDLDNIDKAREINDRWQKSNRQPLLEPMTRVKLLLAEDKYSEAATILEKCLHNGADNGSARLLLADCRYNLGNYELALNLYQELLPQNPGNMGIISRMKECLEILGRTDEALVLFEDLAGKESENAWVQLQLADLYLQTGNHDQAEVYFDLLSGYANPYSRYATEMSAKIAAYKQEKAREKLAEAEQKANSTPDTAHTGVSENIQQSGALTKEKIREVKIEELKKLMAIYE